MRFPTAIPSILAALVCAACATAGSNPPATTGADGAELEAVMQAIQQALSEAQVSDVPGFPPLETVTIKLQTEASRSVGGEIAVYVVTVGSRYSSETASTLELTLKPGDVRASQGLRPGEVREELARAIHVAKVGAATAARGTPPLDLTGVEIDLKFTVETRGTAGAKVVLVPVGGEAGGNIQRSRVHTIRLVFSR